MIKQRKIELLSPAKDCNTGIEAIKHGADAVYIGAPKFGARVAVPNSVDDIKRLCDFAHLYNARIYVALNTILQDKELSEAEHIITQLYYAGTDALIVQDMGILRMDIPPIQLHASTQCDIRNIEKANFLEKSGFSQLVLARELTLEEINLISKSVSVPIETFIHGALCVSYSGQCYISQAMKHRSANRGECAQYCRLPYTLIDGNNNFVFKDKHLLSLRDMNQSNNIFDLLQAGVSSFKIEGRLKDISYVKNVTAYYRGKLDEIIDNTSDYQRASFGYSKYTFTPDLSKSFNRGFTSYFANDRQATDIASIQTPKSIGEKVGNATRVTNNSITIASKIQFHNGDGFGYFDSTGIYQGFRANRVVGSTIFPLAMPHLGCGTTLYRNYNHEFESILSKESANRLISISMKAYTISDGVALDIRDERGNSITAIERVEIQKAKKSQHDIQNINLSKIGNTIYSIEKFENAIPNDCFIPASTLSDLRRNGLSLLDKSNIIRFSRLHRAVEEKHFRINTKYLSYKANVANRYAHQFYIDHGVDKIDSAIEVTNEVPEVLMTTRYCLRRELGACLKSGSKDKLKAPVYLKTGKEIFKVSFDCVKCEMNILSK